jgi:hypothetical protein
MAFPHNEWIFSKSAELSRVLVAYTCNPSYSGSRYQEDPFKVGSKLLWAKYFTRPNLEENTSQKTAPVVPQCLGPEINPQYHKKKTQEPSHFS